MATTQPKEPLMALSNLEFLFQKTVTGFFGLHGKKYMIYADGYMGWVCVMALMLSRNAYDTLWN